MMRRTRANPSPSGHQALEAPKKTRKQPAKAVTISTPTPTPTPTPKRARSVENTSDDESPPPKRAKVAVSKKAPPKKKAAPKKSAPRSPSPKAISPFIPSRRTPIHRPIQSIEEDEDSELNLDDLDSMNQEQWRQIKLDLQYTRLAKKKLDHGQTLRAPPDSIFKGNAKGKSNSTFLLFSGPSDEDSLLLTDKTMIDTLRSVVNWAASNDNDLPSSEALISLLKDDKALRDTARLAVPESTTTSSQLLLEPAAAESSILTITQTPSQNKDDAAHDPVTDQDADFQEAHNGQDVIAHEHQYGHNNTAEDEVMGEDPYTDHIYDDPNEMHDDQEPQDGSRLMMSGGTGEVEEAQVATPRTPAEQLPLKAPAAENLTTIGLVKKIISTPFKFFMGRSQNTDAPPTINNAQPEFTYTHPHTFANPPATPTPYGGRAQTRRTAQSERRRGPKASPLPPLPQTERRRAPRSVAQSKPKPPMHLRGVVTDARRAEMYKQQDEWRKSHRVEEETREEELTHTKSTGTFSADFYTDPTHPNYVPPEERSDDEDDEDEFDPRGPLEVLDGYVPVIGQFQPDDPHYDEKLEAVARNTKWDVTDDTHKGGLSRQQKLWNDRKWVTWKQAQIEGETPEEKAARYATFDRYSDTYIPPHKRDIRTPYCSRFFKQNESVQANINEGKQPLAPRFNPPFEDPLAFTTTTDNPFEKTSSRNATVEDEPEPEEPQVPATPTPKPKKVTFGPSTAEPNAPKTPYRKDSTPFKPSGLRNVMQASPAMSEESEENKENKENNENKRKAAAVAWAKLDTETCIYTQTLDFQPVGNEPGPRLVFGEIPRDENLFSPSILADVDKSFKKNNP